jgi:hypothetical protein
MQNANLSQERSEEQGPRIPDMPPQRSAKAGFASASTIERAAQRLDWTIAFGTRHNNPRGFEETTKQQPRPGPSRLALASQVRSCQRASSPVDLPPLPRVHSSRSGCRNWYFLAYVLCR